MRTTEISDNHIRLLRWHLVLPNAYLVREDDGFTLVDTTVQGAADDLIAVAERAGGLVRRVALTHGHGDHVGSLDALKQRLGSELEVLMPELDARIHAREHVVEGKLPGSWPKIETIPDVRITGGERIGSLEVVPSPGHSPGHVAFLDTRDRTLIAGDVFTSYGSVQVTNHFTMPFPLAQVATWDKQKDLESARALRKLDPAVLLVGHGPAVPNPGDAINDAIRRAEAALS